jgi:RNA polymerase primary sigma factor
MTRGGFKPELGSETGSLARYLQEVREIRLLDLRGEFWLLRRMEDDEPDWALDARRKLILSHLHLVVSIARRFCGRGLPFEDLIQEGTLGLETAVDNFDWRSGNRLATYARWKIASAIDSALANTARTIRIPVHIQRKVGRINRAERKLRQELEREPLIEEIVEVTGFSVAEIDALKANTRPAISLDAPARDGESASQPTRVADESVRPLDEQCIEVEMKRGLPFALGLLQERERTVLELRFGVNGEARVTLEEIGCRLGVSRERVRQIEVEALAKLRSLLERPSALKRRGSHDALVGQVSPGGAP